MCRIFVCIDYDLRSKPIFTIVGYLPLSFVICTHKFVSTQLMIYVHSWLSIITIICENDFTRTRNNAFIWILPAAPILILGISKIKKNVLFIS